MKPKRKLPTVETALVWERAEPAVRPAPGPLSRENIVRAALGLADREGLGSVSLRKIAAALNAGPMRLYGYVSAKEELLELMVDAVFGEMIVAKRNQRRPPDWKESFRSIAQRTRKAALLHPWLVDLLGGRPHLGPNALAYLEESMAALSGTPGFEKIDRVLLAGKIVSAYILGAIRNEMSERRAEAESGLDENGWQAAAGPYMERMIATGRFPTVAKVVRDATHPSLEAVFDQGLECVLAGILERISIE